MPAYRGTATRGAVPLPGQGRPTQERIHQLLGAGRIDADRAARFLAITEPEHAPMLQAIGLYRVLTVTAALGIISEVSSDSEAVASESNLQRSQKSSRGKGKGSSSTRDIMIVAAAPYALPFVTYVCGYLLGSEDRKSSFVSVSSIPASRAPRRSSIARRMTAFLRYVW